MSVGGDVIVLWLTAGRPDVSVWTALLDPELLYAQASPAAMATAIPASLAQGPVIAVVEDDRQAHQALALGVDEVLRAAEVSKQSLAVAAERARLRAVGRDVRPRPLSGDERAQELLGASVSFRLMTPLAMASLNLQVLRAAIGAPAPQELQAPVSGLAAALQEATLAVSQMYMLVAPDSLDDACDLAVVVPEVAQIVRVVVERVADFEIEVTPAETCRVHIPRSVVVQTLSALLTNAVQAVCDRKERGAIKVRVLRHADAALIEVADNGVGMSAAVLERATESFFTTRGKRAAGLGLSFAAERVRRRGGELVLESEPGSGTTARIFAPLALDEATAGGADLN